MWLIGIIISWADLLDARHVIPAAPVSQLSPPWPRCSHPRRMSANICGTIAAPLRPVAWSRTISATDDEPIGTPADMTPAGAMPACESIRHCDESGWYSSIRSRPVHWMSVTLSASREEHDDQHTTATYRRFVHPGIAAHCWVRRLVGLAESESCRTQARRPGISVPQQPTDSLGLFVTVTNKPNEGVCYFARIQQRKMPVAVDGQIPPATRSEFTG